MKVPRNWKLFMSSDENKKALTSFLLNEFQKDSFAPRLFKRELYFVCEDRCELLTSDDGVSVTSKPIQDLFSLQEEADTRIILHCFYVSKQPFTSRIIIKSPDSDVFLLLMSFAEAIGKSIIFDTGTGNNRRLLDMSQLSSSIPEHL
ncbi:hypothetical protein ElyMa_001891000 [Elysia marginata]|uniref:Uncharacterized protein n=1 Tax=Elysia marginata TaxID=1093978 RepID=A0AAV4ES09_9GAST|nr:hypothetical protein ElyMa_001891000 [Elysia marginata]